MGNRSHIIPVAGAAERDMYFYQDTCVICWICTCRLVCDLCDCVWFLQPDTTLFQYLQALLVTGPTAPSRCSAHPDVPKLKVLAELVIHPLAAAVEEVATGIEVEERQDTRLQGLPPPMVPGVHDRAPSSCYMQVRDDGAVQLPPAAAWQDNARVTTCCCYVATG